MAGSTSKKVTIERFDREKLHGYVNPASYLLPGGVELLTESGTVVVVPYSEIRIVRFVKDFEAIGGEGNQQVFLTRPKSEGLWIELHYKDGTIQQGLVPNDLCALEPLGLTLSPPNSMGNSQRLFVPRAVLQSIEVLGVIGTKATRGRRKSAVREGAQIGLFDTPDAPGGQSG